MAMTAEGSVQEPVEETVDPDVTMTPEGPIEEDESEDGKFSESDENMVEDDEKVIENDEIPIEEQDPSLPELSPGESVDSENVKDDDELGDPDEEAYLKHENDYVYGPKEIDAKEPRERLVDSVPTIQNPPNWGHPTDEKFAQMVYAIQILAEKLDLDEDFEAAFPLLYQE